MYNYYEVVREDIQDVAPDYYNDIDCDNLDEFTEIMKERLINDDSVTGNLSGSYTFNIYRAEKNLNGNWDLMRWAFEEYGVKFNFNPEQADVLIRCYILDECLNEIAEDLYADYCESKKS